MIREVALAGLTGALRETGHAIIVIRDDDTAREELVVLGQTEAAARRASAPTKPRRQRVDPAADRDRQKSAAEAKRARKNARRLALSTLPTREA